jgi:iron(III) transport system substrate-binding protein
MHHTGPTISRRLVLGATLATPFIRRAAAATEVNAYSIWPENYAQPVFTVFEQATGIHVNFVRFSSGEALARVIAEKANPQVDLLFGASRIRTACGRRSPTTRWCS